MNAEERDALAKNVFGHTARFVVVRTVSGAYRACVRYRPPWHSIEMNLPSTVFESTSEQEAIEWTERSLAVAAGSKAIDDAWQSALVAAEERDFDALMAAVERLRATRS
jgi:hypothetical protein